MKSISRSVSLSGNVEFVTFGTYAKDKFTKSNCATFVRDFIISSASGLFYQYTGIKFQLLYTPSDVFDAIKSI